MQQMAIPNFLAAVTSWRGEKYHHKTLEQAIFVQQETTSRRGKTMYHRKRRTLSSELRATGLPAFLLKYKT